jgi:hypothetical protein
VAELAIRIAPVGAAARRLREMAPWWRGRPCHRRCSSSAERLKHACVRAFKAARMHLIEAQRIAGVLR